MATYLLENRPETTGYALLHTLSQGDTVIQGEKNTAQTSQRYGDTGLWLPYASDKATGVQRLWTPRRTYFRRWFMPGEPLRFDF